MTCNAPGARGPSRIYYPFLHACNNFQYNVFKQCLIAWTTFPFSPSPFQSWYCPLSSHTYNINTRPNILYEFDEPLCITDSENVYLVISRCHSIGEMLSLQPLYFDECNPVHIHHIKRLEVPTPSHCRQNMCNFGEKYMPFSQ